MYYKIIIDETGHNNMKEKPTIFNTIIEKRHTLKEISQYIIDRYGKMPNQRNKIYINTSINKSKIIGFTHSFWNQDISHNSKKWFQTDWICITKVNEIPVFNLK
jgi:hypothetical protein